MSSLRAIVLAKAFAPDLGGVETYSEQVAFALARLGYKVEVVTQFRGPSGVETRRNGAEKIRVRNVGGATQWAVAGRMLWALAGLNPRGQDVAVIHATTWRAAVPALLLAAGRYSITVHGREVAQTRVALLRRLMAAVFRKARRRIFISRYSEAVCSPLLPDAGTTAVAWNGLSWPNEPAASLPVMGGTLKALVACQLTQRKNVKAAVLAVHQARSSGLDVTLSIAGRGPEEERLKELVSELGLQDVVKFLGIVPRDEMPELYRSHSVFLHPHQHAHDPGDFESFCIAVADAMSFGNIVVAGRDGAPAEYIEAGVNGYLVDGNSVEDLRDRIIDIAHLSAPQAAQISRTARSYSRSSFDWDAHTCSIVGADGVSPR